MEENSNNGITEITESSGYTGFAQYLFYSLVRLISSDDKRRDRNSRGASWIHVLQNCSKSLEKHLQHLILPLIYLIQTMRKTMSEAEMVTHLRIYSKYILELANGNNPKIEPSQGNIPLDENGKPKKLAPWEKALKRKALRDLVVAIWTTVAQFLPISESSEVEGMRTASLVASFPNINQWKEKMTKGKYTLQQKSDKQAAKDGKRTRPAPSRNTQKPKKGKTVVIKQD